MLESLLLTSLLAFGTAAEAQPMSNSFYNENVTQVEEENTNITKPILKRNQRIQSDIFELEYELKLILIMPTLFLIV